MQKEIRTFVAAISALSLLGAARRQAQSKQRRTTRVCPQKYKLACKLAIEKAAEFAFHRQTVPQLAKRDYIASRASH
jgi:hypothetical protein